MKNVIFLKLKKKTKKNHKFFKKSNFILFNFMEKKMPCCAIAHLCKLRCAAVMQDCV